MPLSLRLIFLVLVLALAAHADTVLKVFVSGQIATPVPRSNPGT